MKNYIGEKTIGTLLLVASVLLPMSASAATVQIYPTITSSHGGQANAQDMRSCITADGQTQCDYSVPTFTIPDGSTYSVSITPATGYSYSLESDCSGVAQGDTICHVDYADGYKAPAQAPAPQPAPAPQNAPTSGGVSVPIPTGIPTPTPAPEATTSDATTTQPAPQTILQVVVIHDYATTSPEEASTSAAVADLQTRVGLLEQIVRAMQDLIGKILNFLGL